MNTSISNSTMILLGLFSLTIIGVDASNNFNHNDGARNSPYLYSEIQSLGFDVIYDDDELTSSTSLDNEQSKNHMQTAYDYGYDISVSEFDTDDYEEPGREPSIVGSSVLYDGECYVSSEAMMCNGGGGDNMIDRFIYDDLFDEDDEEVSDDDDDDDNDGHSSMLSTASLRSKSTTRRERTRCHAGGTSTTPSKQQTTYTNNIVKLNNVLQLQPCHVLLEDRRQQLTFHPRSESFAFIRERVSTVASDASKAIKRA
mmetsp:Transcript_4445/g.10713  ORF Transcript_4445/g.10713 Transcript_4445/m.10713 type:complete len:256 (-) Transcript_4445:1938-2705(-)